MAVSNPKTKSTLLDTKTAEDIFSPSAHTFSAAGKEFDIYPLPDGVLMTIADAFGSVIGLLTGLPEKETDAETGKVLPYKISDILPLMPAIIKAVLPNATKIIAAATRQPEPWVAENIGLAKKLEGLRVIFEAEDIPAIIANFQALAGIIPAIPPAQTAD